MDNNVKQRGWVKNAVIIFLALLLFLTFFSNTIMNRTLPEVATATVQSTSITAKVRGSGKVIANGSHNIKAGQTRKVAAVLIKAGQEINAGDVLFILGEGESEEVDALTEKLRQLQLSYSRSAMNVPVFNYTVQERNLKNAETAKNDAKAARDLARLNLNNALAAVGYTEAQLKALEEEIEAKEKAYADACKEADKTREQLKKDMDVAYAAWLDAAVAVENLQLKEGVTEEELNSAIDFRDAADTAYQAATDAYNAAQAETAEEAAAREALNAVNAEYDDLIKTSNAESLKAAYEAAVSAYVTAKQVWADMRDELNFQKQQDNKSLQMAYLDLQDISQQITMVQEQIKELTGESDNQIIADCSGIVQSVNITAGDTPVKGDVLCSVEVPDLGYSLSFSVTNDQSRRVRVGDTATISNYYWGREILATLTSIATDPKAPQTSKVLTFELEGDVNPGNELTISVGSKSATYDLVVPNSSIRSDTNGSYVYVIEAKSNALGNRYFAKRVSVEIIASDDVNSAITGNLSAWDFVITTSSSPIKAGDQVRMADNNQ